MNGFRWTPARRGRLAAMALFSAAIGPLQVAASPVFVSGSIAAHATAHVGSSPDVVDEQSLDFTAPDTRSRLDVSAYAQTGSRASDTQVSARMQIDVDWNGADRGSLSLNQSFGGVSVFTTGEAFAGSPRLWSYTFRVDRDAHLLFQYEVDIDSVLGGTADGGFIFTVGNLAAARLTAGLDGVIDMALQAGETYTIGLRNVVGGFRVSGDSRFSAGYQGFFQWSIEDLPPPAAVSEPATVPLMVLTLMAAVTVRRWRVAATPARPVKTNPPRRCAARAAKARSRSCLGLPQMIRIGEGRSTAACFRVKQRGCGGAPVHRR